MRRCNQLDRLWRARLAIRKCWLRTQATCLPNLSRRHPCSIRGGSLLTMDLDAQLMLGVKEGNDECMDRLSQRYRGPVIHYIFHVVRNRAIAEELAQHVFLRVFRSRA